MLGRVSFQSERLRSDYTPSPPEHRQRDRFKFWSRSHCWHPAANEKQLDSEIFILQPFSPKSVWFARRWVVFQDLRSYKFWSDEPYEVKFLVESALSGSRLRSSCLQKSTHVFRGKSFVLKVKCSEKHRSFWLELKLDALRNGAGEKTLPMIIGGKLEKGISRVANSQRTIAKDHMSAAFQLISLCFFCRISGE